MKVALGGRVTPTSGGSHLVLQTEFAARGPARLALPLLRRRMWPEMERDIHTIKSILEGDRSHADGSQASSEHPGSRL
jgi:hypothetical protein